MPLGTVVGVDDTLDISGDGGLIVVEHMRVIGNPKHSGLNLRTEGLSLCLSQRDFGPRNLLVAFSDAKGHAHDILWANRSDEPHHALLAILDELDRRAAAAVAYNDERAVDGEPPDPEMAQRFRFYRDICGDFGVHLVDWLACDDEAFRSYRWATDPEDSPEWWDVPASSERPVRTIPKRTKNKRRRR